MGRAVCAALEPAGWKVWRLTRRPAANSIAADLCDADALERAAPHQTPGAVIHLAALLPGIPSSDANRDANEMMLDSLMRWMKPRGIAACLFASGCNVYGNVAGACTEETAPAPLDGYAEGKLAAEHALTDGPWRSVSLRIAAPYGPHPGVPTVVHRFLKMAAAGEDITLWGSGVRTQHFVHTADVGQAFLLALESEAAGVFNIAGPSPVSMAQLAAACIRVTGSRSTIRCTGEDPQESYRGWFPWDKAHAAFGYSPLVSLDEGLALTAREMGLL